ncbi:DUF6089 family protein [Bacteroidota bacterium]
MRKTGTVLFMLLVLILSDGFGQRYRPRIKRHEIVFGLGGTAFLGDLGGANRYGTNGLRDLDFPSLRPVIQLGYLYQFRRRWGLKTSLYYARLRGDDKWTEQEERQSRDINFRSPVIELSSQFEFSIISGGRQGRRYFSLSKQRVGYGIMPFSFYIFGGVGGFYFNPRGQYTDGKWYSLKPLSTEGQGIAPTRKNYSLIQLTFPVGLGIKYFINNEWAIGLEYGRRFSFTDYIDDVSKTYFDPDVLETEKGEMAAYFSNPSEFDDPNKSRVPGQQRGDPKDNDTYMYGVITIYYKLAKYSARLFRY